jgi:DNA-binding NtrC family response regulator
MRRPGSPLIAILNSSHDIADLVERALVDEGFRTATFVSAVARGTPDPLRFLATARPQVCVCGVSPPYQESWTILQVIRAQYASCGYVVTTTSIRGLHAFVGPTDAIELIGQPFDLAQIVQAVRQLLPTDGAVWPA